MDGLCEGEQADTFCLGKTCKAVCPSLNTRACNLIELCNKNPSRNLSTGGYFCIVFLTGRVFSFSLGFSALIRVCVLTRCPRRSHVTAWYCCCWPTSWTWRTGDRWMLGRGRGWPRWDPFEYSNCILQWFTRSSEFNVLLRTATPSLVLRVQRQNWTEPGGADGWAGQVGHPAGSFAAAIQFSIVCNVLRITFYLDLQRIII